MREEVIREERAKEVRTKEESAKEERTKEVRAKGMNGQPGSNRKGVAGKSISILSEYVMGDMTARYLTDERGQVGLWLYPTAFANRLAKRRETLCNESWAHSFGRVRTAIVVEPLVHLKISGDAQPDGFGQGRTMKWSPSNDRFCLIDQREEADSIVTIMEDATGLRVIHRLGTGPQKQTLLSETKFVNGSKGPVKLELLTSFSLSGISPFSADDAAGRLIMHRFRSAWSAEGRLVSEPIEALHLERTWAGETHLSERFGQVGSMPARGWFPTALVEDSAMGVIWGARLGVATSWQMEAGRRHDDLGLSGGLADREFGHWIKTVESGASFTAPIAWLTCVAGTVDDACARLVSADVPAADSAPSVEQDLPITYNDWCANWGNPREEQLLSIADKIASLGIRYMVIDAGWYMSEEKGAKWSDTFGDWEADRGRFPNGLAATAAAISKRGMIPGIWFEPEHVAAKSAAYHDTDHMLARDGEPITIGVRRAWNLHDPYAAAYIKERMIKLLEDAGFGYLKLDYSETLGIGVDHCDSLGEGLRQHGEGTLAMLGQIRRALPNLVIEICCAGGQRSVASFLQRGAMSSFSDAHEVVEIPIVAASLQRLMLPRQSQIWAALHSSDTRQRLEYSLAAAFLGRMCLSGKIHELDQAQLAVVRDAIDLYRQAVPIIKHGVSRLSENRGMSWRHPTGWQAVVRTTKKQGLIVLHAFEKSPQEMIVELPGHGWKITRSLAAVPSTLRDGRLIVTGLADFAAQVLLIER